mgnify:CR=1 FL=1
MRIAMPSHAARIGPLLVGAALLAGCDDTIFGPGGEPVEGEGYTAVLSISESQCVGCHSAAAPQGNLDLESDFIGATVDVVGAFGEPIIVPGEPENSLLYLMTAGNPPVSSAMPLGSGGLSAEENQIIEQWIIDGALDQ